VIIDGKRNDRRARLVETKYANIDAFLDKSLEEIAADYDLGIAELEDLVSKASTHFRFGLSALETKPTKKEIADFIAFMLEDENAFKRSMRRQVYRIYADLDDMMHSGEWKGIDDALKSIDVETSNHYILVGCLSATLVCKDKLVERSSLYKASYDKAVRDGRDAESLYGELE